MANQGCDDMKSVRNSKIPYKGRRLKTNRVCYDGIVRK